MFKRKQSAVTQVLIYPQSPKGNVGGGDKVLNFLSIPFFTGFEKLLYFSFKLPFFNELIHDYSPLGI